MEPCEYCDGSGIDTDKAVIPMLEEMVPFVAALHPCPECKGEGEVESAMMVEDDGARFDTSAERQDFYS